MLLETQLLQKGFSYQGMKYDVYGTPETEDEECVIDEICLPSTRINVMYMMSQYDIDLIGYWVGVALHMERLAELREARAERAIYEHEEKKLDYQWRSF